MNWNLLYKYVNGTCTRNELRQISEWLKENPANEDFFTSFIENVYKEDIDFEVDAQAAWEEFKRRNENASHSHRETKEISTGLKPLENTQDIFTANKKRSIKWAYAAVAVILITASFFVFVINSKKSVKKNSQIAFQNITTSKGQRTTINLSDGTKVILNADSKLKIPKNYDQTDRRIYLQGEAFFKVKHDAQHPFMVIVNHNFIKDLGTQFNVTAYDTSKMVVVVRAGLISLGQMEQNNQSNTLARISPNKRGVLDNSGNLTISKVHDINRYIGWTKGELIFHQTPFQEVVKRLGRWYNIDCKIGDPDLKNRTLTATYNNLSESEALKVLSMTMNINYIRHNRAIIFRTK